MKETLKSDENGIGRKLDFHRPGDEPGGQHHPYPRLMTWKLPTLESDLKTEIEESKRTDPEYRVGRNRYMKRCKGDTDQWFLDFPAPVKGTIMKELLEKYEETYALSVSATTRDPREGREQEGREYFFRSVEEFEKMIATRRTDRVC